MTTWTKAAFAKVVFALFLAGTLLVMGDLNPAAAVEKVVVRAAEHPNFGRLVLDWGQPRKYEADIRDGYLVVTFRAPFEANLKPVGAALGKYISSSEIYNNNKSIRFKLKGNYTLKTALYGSAIALDLSPVKAAGSGLEDVRVRVGDHEKYSRLVIDWPATTGYKVEQNGADVKLVFDKAAKLDIARVKRDLPKYITGVSTDTSGSQSILTVQTKGPMAVKAFRSGTSVAVDFTPGKAEAEISAKTEPEKVKKTPVKKITPAKTPVQKITAIEESEKKKAEPRSVSALAEPQPEKKTETGVKSASEPASNNEPKTAPRSLLPPTTEKPKAVIVPPSEKLTIEVGNLKDGFRLIFPWKQSAAMALFARSDNFWLVFDKRVKFDFKKLSGPYKFLVLRKKQIAHETASIIQMSVRDGYMPSVTRTGNEWRVDFRLGESPVIKNTIDIQSQPSAQNGARVFIPAVNNGDKISFQDPQVGDELITVPLYTPSWGFGRTRTFTQFTILASMQGIAMTARDSSVAVTVERNGVAITAAGGLQLSRAISQKDMFASGDQTDRFSGKKDKAQLVKLDEWAQVPLDEFIEKKQYLQRKVARSPKAGRNASRMELAKFFVAHKYYADAIGVLERIRMDDPRADEDGIYRLLRGLANLGMNHLDEAEIDLFNPVFSGVAEVAPWRAMVAAKKGNWKLAAEELKIGQDAFGVYNADLNNEFNLLAAEAALEDFDIELATTSLEKIKTSVEEGVNKKVAATREYLEGIAALRSGDVDRAIGKFDQAIALDYRPITARARYEKINAELAQKILTPAEAIEEFKKMSFSWRGDELELDILKRIGDLHIASGEIDEGLKAFRNIVMTFPKTRVARDVAREMNDLFSQLFIEGKAEKLSPVKALALYYEYRELTPLGKKGDEMIRNLADRLIKVDLLEQAIQLLEHQVNFRLKGELKALTGTKLAVILLWDGKPKEALSILRKTRWRALPDKVKNERRFIQARAYADLDEFEEALSLIDEDKGQTANLLRADIYWKAKDWPKAVAALEKLMANSGADKAEKLSGTDRKRLMQIAVARALSGDQAGIDQMRKKYRRKLVGTPDLDAFDLITDNTDGSETAFRERASAIAKVSQLESFMSGYRKQLKEGKFWATN